MKWTIGTKLIAGFAGLSTILILTVFLNYRGLQQNESLVNQVVEIRSPTTQASFRFLNGINQSLAALRGWMLLGNTDFKSVREDAWRNGIDAPYEELQKLSQNWTNAENVKRLKEIGSQLETFRRYQQEIENMANADDNIPAIKMLLTQVTPQGDIMGVKITEMIDLELKDQASSKERKEILGMMADVRGTLGLGLASIRAYLLSGDTKFRDEFQTLWAKNERRFDDLQSAYESLNSQQKRAFDAFSSARSEFVKYPDQMFALRAGEEWNQANYWLATKAAPTAQSLTQLLNEMVTDQQQLLTTDNGNLANLSQSMKLNSIILALVGLALAIIITIVIFRSITLPIARLTNNIKTVADGDLTIEVEANSNDEIGQALKAMKAMVAKLKEVISFVGTASNNIAAASLQMSSSSQSMSEGATEQAASTEQVASSMEEMAANIQQNTDNARQTEKIALKAAEDIKEGSQAVNQTVDSMKLIAEKISIIEEIARQTNLLALNAAVEAARAGEHGKGFAVVAAEVRKLAERSQNAANEINGVSVSSVDVAQKSGKLLEQIVPNIQKTAELVQEITASSQEQNSGADQVNNAIQQLNQVVQQNASSSEEMAASSEELSSQAEQLKEAIAFFKVDHATLQNTFKSRLHTVHVDKVKASFKNEIHEKSAKTKGTGIVLDMDSEKGDAHDSEYEKF